MFWIPPLRNSIFLLKNMNLNYKFISFACVCFWNWKIREKEEELVNLMWDISIRYSSVNIHSKKSLNIVSVEKCFVEISTYRMYHNWMTITRCRMELNNLFSFDQNIQIWNAHKTEITFQDFQHFKYFFLLLHLIGGGRKRLKNDLACIQILIFSHLFCF